MPVATDTTEAVPRPDAANGPGLGRRMRRGALWLSVLTLLASAVNYGSNLIFSRILTPASYGDLTALLALSVVIAVPFTAAQTRVAEKVASFAAQDNWERVQYTVRHAMAHLTVLAGIGTALYLATVPLLEDLLDLQAPGPALALAALIFVGFLFPVLLGALQGLERWTAFGVVALAIAVARILFGVPWAEAGGGSGGAIAGQAVGTGVCLLGLLWLLRHHVRRTGNAAGWAGLRHRPDVRAAAAGAAFTFFAVIANCDVVLAKAFLDPQEAGEYAALATIGKVVTFLPAAVAVTVVPHAARAGASPADRSRVLRIAALLVAMAAAIAIIPAALAPTFVVEHMFGDEYLAATSGVLPIVCAGGGLSLLYLLVTFTVTIEDHRWTWLLVLGVVVQVAGISLFHDSVTQVAGVQAAAVALVLLVNEARYHALLRPTSRG
ncbi:MAG TPA: hypothetical protein VD931_03510 [Baekduia sp.]|nr:hypothetical protein [Baekduia sp.]